jgi:RNA polymerase sigma-70 factor (ECF subfamily)
MQETEIPIRELLLLCLRSEDETLWEEFVRRTQPLIANVIINTLRRWRDPSPALVDDLIQETHLKLFANDRKYLRGIRNDHENAVFGYLRMAASSVTQDYFRRPENKAPEVELTDQVLPPSSAAADRMEFMQRKSEIQSKLTGLSGSPTYKRDGSIFWLYYEQGYTAKEISMFPHFRLTEKGVEAVLLRLARYLRESGSEAAGHGNDD